MGFYTATSCVWHRPTSGREVRWRNGQRQRRRRQAVRPRAQGDARRGLLRLREADAGALQARWDATRLLPRVLPEAAPAAVLGPERRPKDFEKLSGSAARVRPGRFFLSSIGERERRTSK